MEKIVIIDGKEVGLRATARTPRIYRVTTGRDLILDLALINDYLKDREHQSEIMINALSAFEDFAFVMAKQYAEAHELEFPEESDEWLDEFEVFDIYSVMPHVLQLWKDNSKTTSVAKKNRVKPSEK